MKKELKLVGALFIVAIVASSFVLLQDNATYKKKEVPAEYKTKKNPYKDDQSLTMIGLRNFNRHCVSCHGKKGIGDGVMARNMKTKPGNLTLPQLAEYTDGELYYLAFIGINDRPDFMKLIPEEEDKWAVVNYIRTLSAK